MSQTSTTQRLIRVIVFFIAIAVLVLVIKSSMNRMAEFSMGPPPAPPAATALPEVAVTNVLPADYEALITAYGSVEAHYAVDLTAMVAGRIVSLSEEFETGQRVKAGTVLAVIDDTAYRAAIASAENTLAQAKVDLLEEERESTQAKLEWKASGLTGEPDSDLVLRKPQLASKRAALKNAQVALENSKKDLTYTQIIAPFDAVIVSREIAPGSYVSSGMSLASLYSTDRVEISLALSDKDWTNLVSSIDQESALLGKSVTLQSVDQGQHWQGQILRMEHHLDDQTRQRNVIVAVEDPFSQAFPLLPGSFVQAQLRGGKQSNIWKLPSTALSQRGEIWLIDENNTLFNLSATPLFTDQESIYVKVPENLKQLIRQSVTPEHTTAVVRQPLNSYLRGMQVKPVTPLPTVAIQGQNLEGVKPDA